MIFWTVQFNSKSYMHEWLLVTSDVQSKWCSTGLLEHRLLYSHLLPQKHAVTNACLPAGTWKRMAGVLPEGNFRERVTCTPLPRVNKVVHSCFQTQRRCHQKSKTGVSVASQKRFMSSKSFFFKISVSIAWCEQPLTLELCDYVAGKQCRSHTTENNSWFNIRGSGPDDGPPCKGTIQYYSESLASHH